jgi:uncharacterized membrane protein YkoI
MRSSPQAMMAVMNIRYLAPVCAALLALALHVHAESKEPAVALKSEAKVTEEAATKTALAAVPTGKVKEAELEREHGKLVWSFDLALPKTKDITEVQVDARTGELVSTEVETAADQAKEKAEDKSEDKD